MFFISHTLLYAHFLSSALVREYFGRVARLEGFLRGNSNSQVIEVLGNDL